MSASDALAWKEVASAVALMASFSIVAPEEAPSGAVAVVASVVGATVVLERSRSGLSVPAERAETDSVSDLFETPQAPSSKLALTTAADTLTVARRPRVVLFRGTFMVRPSKVVRARPVGWGASHLRTGYAYPGLEGAAGNVQG